MQTTSAVRRLLLTIVLAAGTAAGTALAQINVNISLAPPAPQHEIVPAMNPGYVWAPGYWGWSGERHVWVRGRSIAQRDGFRWAPDRWDQRDSAYYRTAGHWERDNDFKPGKVKKAKKEHGDDHDNGNHGRGDKGKHRGND